MSVFQNLNDLDLHSLSERSDTKGILQLTGHVGLLAVTGLAVSFAHDTGWQFPAMVVHGIALVFLFTTLHETTHRTAFRTRWLNDLVALICGLLLLLPPRYFRTFHIAHHRHTQNPNLDPELMVPKPGGLGRYLWVMSGIPYWIERMITITRHARSQVSEAFISTRRRQGIVNEARIFLLFYALIVGITLALDNGLMMTYWLLPALLGQPFLRIFLLAEHIGCPYDPDSFKNSRTTESNRFVRWLSWNMPFHAEHHAYPALPFHALPHAHKVLDEQLSVQSKRYFDVHRQIIKTLAFSSSSTQ